LVDEKFILHRERDELCEVPAAASVRNYKGRRFDTRLWNRMKQLGAGAPLGRRARDCRLAPTGAPFIPPLEDDLFLGLWQGLRPTA
jgi:hypothetical protein